MAGIKKRIYPHLFRHSRATALANHLTEAQMKVYLGWTQSSNMTSVYIHLSGKETDVAILKANGIKVEEEEPITEIKPTKCPRCKTDNSATNKYCKMCSMALDDQIKKKMIVEESKRLEVDSLMDDILQDKEILNILIEKIKERRMEA